MNPEEFVNKGVVSPDDLIGKAGKISKLFCAKAQSNAVIPMRLLFHGEAGIGKSASAKLIAGALNPNMAMIRHLSAKSITPEMVRDWMMDLCFARDDWNVILIEEVDAIQDAVEVLLLQYMDKMTDKTALIMTSNEKMSGITDRFSSRAQVFQFDLPHVKDVADFIKDRWPELEDVADEIAHNNNGDVRASLNDSQTEWDIRKFLS